MATLFLDDLGYFLLQLQCLKYLSLIIRLSRARRVVENAFGILASRFEVYRSPMRFKLCTIRKIVLATVVLHNYLRQRRATSLSYMPGGSIDVEEIAKVNKKVTYNLKKGSWRDLPKAEGISNLSSCTGENAPTEAKKIRDAFCDYFNKEGAVYWQEKAMLNH